jgi:hypothetical protein
LAVVQDIGFRILSSKGHYTTPARHAVVWTKGEAGMWVCSISIQNLESSSSLVSTSILSYLSTTTYDHLLAYSRLAVLLTRIAFFRPKATPSRLLLSHLLQPATSPKASHTTLHLPAATTVTTTVYRSTTQVSPLHTNTAGCILYNVRPTSKRFTTSKPTPTCSTVPKPLKPPASPIAHRSSSLHAPCNTTPPTVQS